jgi:hypothetical protein
MFGCTSTLQNPSGVSEERSDFCPYVKKTLQRLLSSAAKHAEICSFFCTYAQNTCVTAYTKKFFY